MKGPSIKKTEEFNICNGCDFLNQRMIKSGMNPIRKYICTNPETLGSNKPYEKGYICTDEKSFDIKTPDFCPFL